MLWRGWLLRQNGSQMNDLAVTALKNKDFTAAQLADGFQMMEVRGIKLRVYTRHLDRPGVPLLICNGLGQAVEILFPLMDEMPDRPIIAFDAAGVGRSHLPESPLSIPEHAELVSQMLDSLGVPQVDVAGISWGGALAQQIAREHAGQVRKLILAITSTGGMATWWGSPIAMFEIQFPMRYLNKSYGNFVGPFMYGGEALARPDLFKEYTKHALRPSYEGYKAQVQAMCSWTSLGWVHKLEQPTLVISGLYDALIPAFNQFTLASLIPGSKLATYPAGHLLMYSKRVEVSQEIIEFLR